MSLSATRWRWLLPAALVIVWLTVGSVGGPFAGKLSEVSENDNAAFLPSSAESTEVAEARAASSDDDTIPAVVIWEDVDATAAATTSDAAAQLAAVAELPGVAGEVSPPIPAEDGEALTAFVPIGTDGGPEVDAVVEETRGAVAGIGGGAVYVTGPAGFAADLGSAFSGIDGVLLVVALSVVLVILLVVYRSPVLPIVVLLSALFGLGLAAWAVYQLADAGTLTLNGQSQGIMSILVVGAATDYALLLVARYREQLSQQDDRFAAMATALRRAAGPILASGGTVIAGVLCLLLSDLNSNRSLGPVAALGIGASLLVALTFLPAVLALLGRAAFWPFRPARPGRGSVEDEAPEARRGLWGGVARLVARRPRPIWVGVTVALAALAALVPMFEADGVSETDLFLDRVEAVAGQEALSRHYPGGSGSPVVVVADAADTEAVVGIVTATNGISDAAPADTPDDRVIIEATLTDAADGDAAIGTVRELRTALDDVSSDVLVGGRTAELLDSNEISARDRTVIIPIVLVVILLVLIVLLRSVLAPVLLVLTVVLSFGATLGVAALVFDQVLGWPGADPGVPLFAFVFLVALGIDYNIFLMSRVREESLELGTRPGVLRGLAVTGGVITSAGLVLAATFSALAVIPILFLAQIAFLVAFGVLLDTFVVRSLLVPALAYDLGSRVWWPSRRLGGRGAGDG
ncbi:MMPL family transporter [Jiangella gansuensis]|uniref:MMPL family transporter n=1 Tax=Jiangella gansuensis TaxID=281473 RepID=UPI00047A3D9E|nr:MMPL family transporter [Jiangella gansuensis]